MTQDVSMRLEEETARLKKEVASLKIQVHLRELEREAWRACATQLRYLLDPAWGTLGDRAEAIAKYEQLSRPDSDYVWPE